MSTRLVLRIERAGRLLGSWSLGDEPLEMKMMDLATGQVVARFTASAEQLGLGSVDEVPVGLPRLEDDDFTMPLPEPTLTGPGAVETDERSQPGRRRVPNLARLAREAEGMDGLTSELIDIDSLDDGSLDDEAYDEPYEEPYDQDYGLTHELLPFDEDDEGAPTSELGSGSLASPEYLPTAKVRPPDPDAAGQLGDEGHDHQPLDEIPLPFRPTAAGLTAELRTATAGVPRLRRADDEPSLTSRAPAGLARNQTDPEHTPQALVRPAGRRAPDPQPAEVWAQKRGEWRNVGHLIPGQRVRTLGGWVRLASDGRLMVSSGSTLAGTATLLDGRMLEIAAGQRFVALPAGSSVMLAVGDRGIYVRSEPLPADVAAAAARAH